ncbi:MAG: hypothetical protein KKG35_06910 [Proteobacteria bacterium]|nr:hypothetical protein [Pseudomonadota bacterium]
MKKIIIITLAMLLSGGVALAAGGKNHGTTGKGKVVTGSNAQGQASQDRTGR